MFGINPRTAKAQINKIDWEVVDQETRPSSKCKAGSLAPHIGLCEEVIMIRGDKHKSIYPEWEEASLDSSWSGFK